MNAAFCALILGKIDVADYYLNTQPFSIENYVYPLVLNNKALFCYFSGDFHSAVRYTNEGLDWIKENPDKAGIKALLILKNEKVTPVNDVPIDSALLINLYSYGEIDKKELNRRLMKINPKSFKRLALLVN